MSPSAALSGGGGVEWPQRVHAYAGVPDPYGRVRPRDEPDKARPLNTLIVAGRGFRVRLMPGPPW